MEIKRGRRNFVQFSRYIFLLNALHWNNWILMLCCGKKNILGLFCIWTFWVLCKKFTIHKFFSKTRFPSLEIKKSCRVRFISFMLALLKLNFPYVTSFAIENRFSFRTTSEAKKEKNQIFMRQKISHFLMPVLINILTDFTHTFRSPPCKRKFYSYTYLAPPLRKKIWNICWCFFRVKKENFLLPFRLSFTEEVGLISF